MVDIRLRVRLYSRNCSTGPKQIPLKRFIFISVKSTDQQQRSLDNDRRHIVSLQPSLFLHPQPTTENNHIQVNRG